MEGTPRVVNRFPYVLVPVAVADMLGCLRAFKKDLVLNATAADQLTSVKEKDGLIIVEVVPFSGCEDRQSRATSNWNRGDGSNPIVKHVTKLLNTFHVCRVVGTARGYVRVQRGMDASPQAAKAEDMESS